MLYKTIFAASVVAVAGFNAPISKLGESSVSAAAASTLAAGVLTLAAAPAFAGDVDAGSSVFSGNCAACHAGGMNVIMPEKTLQKDVSPCLLTNVVPNV